MLDILRWIWTQFCHHKSQNTYANERILVVDLDGIIANFQLGFTEWLAEVVYNNQMVIDSFPDFQFDFDRGWSSENWKRWGDKFESEGGYASLPSFPDGVAFILSAQAMGWKIVVTTARPLNKFRIWYDSLHWLENYHIIPDVLLATSTKRVVQAILYQSQNNIVLALEDEPELIRQYLAAGIFCLIRAHKYNREYVQPESYYTRTSNFLQESELLQIKNSQN